jgi:phosphoglycolate phosphatase
MFAVGVLWGFRTADELMDNGADLIIEKPLDIFKFIQTE